MLGARASYVDSVMVYDIYLEHTSLSLIRSTIKEFRLEQTMEDENLSKHCVTDATQ